MRAGSWARRTSPGAPEPCPAASFCAASARLAGSIRSPNAWPFSPPPATALSAGLASTILASKGSSPSSSAAPNGEAAAKASSTLGGGGTAPEKAVSTSRAADGRADQQHEARQRRRAGIHRRRGGEGDSHQEEDHRSGRQRVEVTLAGLADLWLGHGQRQRLLARPHRASDALARRITHVHSLTRFNALQGAASERPGGGLASGVEDEADDPGDRLVVRRRDDLVHIDGGI